MKEFKTEAITENLHSVLEFIDGQLELIGCPTKPQMQIDISVEEIFVNIARYAYTPGTGKATIRVELYNNPSGIEITFIDRGVPYDPLAKPDPNITLSAKERKIGGLGIFMTKKFMDDLSYEYRDGQNVFSMKKNL